MAVYMDPLGKDVLGVSDFRVPKSSRFGILKGMVGPDELDCAFNISIFEA